MNNNTKLHEADRLLIELIKEYISRARYSVSLLKEIYSGPESLLYAYKVLKLIPKEGRIGEVYYQFHGSGCYFEYPNDRIDLEFGPEHNRCDGFDLFRINDFLKNREHRFKHLTDEHILSQAFNRLIDQNVLVKHPLEADVNLYYLKNELVEFGN